MQATGATAEFGQDDDGEPALAGLPPLSVAFSMPMATAPTPYGPVAVRAGLPTRRRLHERAPVQLPPAPVIPPDRLLRLPTTGVPERRRIVAPPPVPERRRPVPTTATPQPALLAAPFPARPRDPAKMLLKMAAVVAIIFAWGLFYLSVKALMSSGSRAAEGPKPGAPAAVAVAPPKDAVL